MYQDFEKMSVHSRIWIYQTDRLLTAKEENISSYFLKNAIENWAAHGEPLLASFKIEYNRFVIIAADDAHHAPSGCSIDASTRWLKELGEQLNIDFFDRSLAYLDGKEIKTVEVFKLKNAIENGLLTSESLVFNNSTIQSISQLISAWKIPAFKLPFLSKYFQKQVA